MTRNEYNAPFISREESEARHRTYYAQFVTEGVRLLVVHEIGVTRILGSQDRSFNDIPLRRWDALMPRLRGFGVADRLKEQGDLLTPSTSVCVLKEAALQLKEKWGTGCGNVDVCDECNCEIPDVEGGGLFNRYHAESCSLYDPTKD